MSNQVSSGASSSIFNHELRAPVSRSVFDLSFIHSFSADFGELIPFALYDCVPNDDFRLSNIVRVSTLPMVSPVYNAIKIRTYWFYVPYYLLWHHFDRFISGGRDGTYSVTPPVIGDSSTGIKFDRGSIGDYFNFPVDVQIPPEDCPSAFPFMAYQRIYRDYFLNQDVQTDSNVNNWFPEDDMDFQLADGFQSSIAPEGTGTEVSPLEPVDLTAKRYRNWEKDYFTSAMFSPQRGPATALPIQLSGTTDVSIPVSTPVEQGVSATDVYRLYADAPVLGTSKNASFLANFSDSRTYGLEVFPNGSQLHLGAVDAGTVKGFEVDRQALSSYMSTSSGGFLIDDLRLATQLQLWLERNMRTKAQYNEFLRIHFNDAPIDLRLTKPYYIGGSSQVLNVTQVLQTSQSTDDSELGQRAGTGNSYGAFNIGRFHSHEFGLIMGIMSIMPDAMYTQGMSRVWSKRSRYDYYFPEFAQLSPQAVLSKELYTSTDTSANNAVFGYQGRYDEYRTATNYVTGLLRDSTKLDFYTYTLARDFDSMPTLSPEFISSEGTVRHDSFVAGTALPPFICQVGVGCRAVRPLPYVNQPMGLL